MSYPRVRIGDILDLKYGKSLPSDIRSGAGYKVYGSNGMTGLHEIAITSSPAIIVGRKGSIGEIHYSDKPCWPIDTTYYVDSFGDSVAPRWLYHRLQNLNLKALNKAVAIPGLNRNDVYQLEIPLPPLEEQRRIATILDKAACISYLLEKKEIAIATLIHSAFIELFGHPRETLSSSRFPIRNLGDCCTLFSGGTLPAGETNTGQEGGYLLLKVSDMNLPGNEISINTSKLWSLVPGAKSATCPAGSVVIPKRGGAIGTNKKRLVDREAVLDPNLMAITPIYNLITIEYLYGWFSFLDLSSITNGSSVPQLNKQDLSPLEIVLPPVETQVKYKKALSQIWLMSESLKRQATLLQSLLLNLQHTVFQAAS